MITVPGAKKTAKAGRSAPLFEGLNMSIGKIKSGGETQGREGGVPTEITRKTIVKGPQAPKDTVFGLKDIRLDRGTGKAAEGGSGVGVSRATRPKDDALGASDIRFGPADRAKDVLFTSRDLQMKDAGIRPTDKSLLSPGKGRVPAAGQPKELDPGRRRIEMIDPSAADKPAGSRRRNRGAGARKTTKRSAGSIKSGNVFYLHDTFSHEPLYSVSSAMTGEWTSPWERYQPRMRETPSTADPSPYHTSVIPGEPGKEKGILLDFDLRSVGARGYVYHGNIRGIIRVGDMADHLHMVLSRREIRDDHGVGVRAHQPGRLIS